MSFEHDETLGKIRSVFEKVFSMDPNEVTTETSLENTKEWDSLQHMELVMALETEFQTQFEMGEILELQSVKSILTTLEKKMAA